MQETQQFRSYVHSPVQVIVAEANEMGCQLVANAFRSRRNHVTIVASAVSSRQAFSLLKEREPDVALISAHLADGPFEGYNVLRELRSLHSRTRAIMLMESRERELVVDAFRCGARGVIFRDEPLEILEKCIQAVHKGQVWANSQHLGYLLDELARGLPIRVRNARGENLLSKRESELVRLVGEGLTNQEIAAQLHLSTHTVKNYIFKIYETLGLSTRVELVLYCLQERQRAPGEKAG